MNCPKCESERIVKNGSIHNGKPKYWCKGCGRQFVVDPQPYRISAEKREMVDRLLLERISLAGIARVVGVSKRWVQYYVNAKYATQARQVKVTPKKNAFDDSLR
jgi:insertion element IS1 protein InsB